MSDGKEEMVKETSEKEEAKSHKAAKRPAKKVAAPKEAEAKETASEEKAIVPAAPSAPQKAEKAEAEIVAKPEVEVVEKGAYQVKKKPELDARTRTLLDLRDEMSHGRPQFLRQEWFRFPRLGEKWRRPRGQHSKMRRHVSYRPVVVSIGYRGPKAARDLHPSGFREVMVYNPDQLEGVDPKVEAVRIGSSVGFKKRQAIEARADELGIRVLNRTG